MHTRDHQDSAGGTRLEPVAPATDAPAPPPWAELEAGIQAVISDLRAVKRKLAEVTEYDFRTKRMQCRWARGYGSDGPIKMIDMLMYSLREGLPVELSDQPPGFVTAGWAKRRERFEQSRRS